MCDRHISVSLNYYNYELLGQNYEIQGAKWCQYFHQVSYEKSLEVSFNPSWLNSREHYSGVSLFSADKLFNHCSAVGVVLFKKSCMFNICVAWQCVLSIDQCRSEKGPEQLCFEVQAFVSLTITAGWGANENWASGPLNSGQRSVSM